MNTEIDDLHTVTQRYRTPEVLRRDSPYHSGFMSPWTIPTNPMHCYWKHFQVLFLAFCKNWCGFRKQKNKNLKPSVWSDSTELILIVHGHRWQIGFPTEICPGGLALTQCNGLHHGFAGSCRSGAEQVSGSSFCSSGHYDRWREFGEPACRGQLHTHTSINGAWPKHSCQLLSRLPSEYFITFEETPPQRR